FAG
ncbi:response regulator, partial [Vibrio parahaemolyticus V-223/04]